MLFSGDLYQSWVGCENPHRLAVREGFLNAFLFTVFEFMVVMVLESDLAVREVARKMPGHGQSS
jgi:hypothetical protein